MYNSSKAFQTFLLCLALQASGHLTDAFSPTSSPIPSAATTSPLFRKHYGPTPPSCQDSSSNSASHSMLNGSSPLSKVNIRALQQLGYPQGFCHALAQGASIHVKRYFIMDDSYSMSTRDGHFLLYTQKTVGHRHGAQGRPPQPEEVIEMAPCTRWNELQEMSLQHAILAQHLMIPTDFRLLNDGTGHFRIPRTFGARGALDSSTNTNYTADLQQAQKVLTRAKPKGVTPLTERLMTVHREIQGSVLPKLEVGQKVAIVIATDGLPTKSMPAGQDDSVQSDPQHGLSTAQCKDDFRQALRALPSQQISVVIRLCTDDEAVVEYYHTLEAELPHVHVVDDYWAEAARVQEFNPWLNYGLVLHRIREMACCSTHNMPLLKKLPNAL